MAKKREEKEKIVKNLEESFKKAKIVIFSDYTGLKVKEMQKLREILKEKGKFLVTKKTLLKKAMDKIGLKIEDKILEGLGLLFAEKDLDPLKILVDFLKEHEKLKIKGGFLEGQTLSLEEILNLAKLPTKKELLTKLVFQIKSPLINLENVLKTNLIRLIYIFKQIKQ